MNCSLSKCGSPPSSTNITHELNQNRLGPLPRPTELQSSLMRLSR
jgi:hypothetical protein